MTILRLSSHNYLPTILNPQPAARNSRLKMKATTIVLTALAIFAPTVLARCGKTGVGTTENGCAEGVSIA